MPPYSAKKQLSKNASSASHTKLLLLYIQGAVGT